MQQTPVRLFKEEPMKKIFTIVLTTTVLFSFATAGVGKEETKAQSGEELFKTHCAECHPKGRNIINPMRTLHKKDRDANNIKKPQDIIEKMRNPGPGMTTFDKTTISDKDAKKIADYIFKTFN
jgi:cytochrome c6